MQMSIDDRDFPSVKTNRSPKVIVEHLRFRDHCSAPQPGHLRGYPLGAKILKLSDQAEVENYNTAVFFDKNILWLQISMEQTVFVQDMNSLCQLKEGISDP